MYMYICFSIYCLDCYIYSYIYCSAMICCNLCRYLTMVSNRGILYVKQYNFEIVQAVHWQICKFVNNIMFISLKSYGNGCLKIYCQIIEM